MCWNFTQGRKPCGSALGWARMVCSRCLPDGSISQHPAQVPAHIPSSCTKPGSGLSLPSAVFSTASTILKFWVHFGSANSMASCWNRRSAIIWAACGVFSFLTCFYSSIWQLKSRGTESLQQIFAFLSTAVATGRLVVRCVVLKPRSYVWLLDMNPSQKHPAQVDKAVAEMWMYYDKVKRAFVAEIDIKILTSSLPL